jgi:hypothetical protein
VFDFEEGQGAHARGAGKGSVMQSATGRATPWEWRRFGMKRVRSFAGIGKTPAAHIANTLQGCHPSVTSLKARRAVLQVPQRTSKRACAP